MNLKNIYLDMRLGGVTINPVIQAINFIMISYTMVTVSLNLEISFWIYAPLFILGVLTSFTLMGNIFRHKQLSTDLDLTYQKQIELNKTLLELQKDLKVIKSALNIPIDNSSNDRIDVVQKISRLK